ncbi:MAG: flavodoxin family protein [Alphaproteobacteria bacterium]|nr:flavodoxin family protein [Alphaproteobacteria bacterium]
MNIFYVYAHPEPMSFNGALKNRALAELRGAGHSVVVSDLHADGFEAVHSRADFTVVADERTFRYGREQANATRLHGLAPDIQAEVDKLFACDVLILQFPLWWFSVPAILKGWFDRVYAYGTLYDRERFYDRGVLRGRRAMCALTMGAFPGKFMPDGCHGDLMLNLWPVHNGSLYYVGFDVLPPFAVAAVDHMSEAEKTAQLDAYAERLRTLQTTTPLDFHSRDDYGDDLRFKPGVVARTIAQRNVG